METTLTTFSELRTIAQLIKKSIDKSYLNESWRETITYSGRRNYDDIVLTESGYYATTEDCAEIEGRYYHRQNDSDDLCYDEIDEEYILQNDARLVYGGRGNDFYTHIDNCDYSHEIYRHEGDYITTDYMEHNSLVFDVDGDIMHVDDVYYWECDGEYHDSPEEEEEEEEEGAKLINGYSYKPTPKFFTLPYDDKNTPFLGIELEIERRNSNSIKHGELAQQIENERWYFKSDGSLTDGFEIVTHPLTFNYLIHAKESILNSLKVISDNGYNSYNANTCGMHVHISKKSFTTWQLYRFMKFFVENKEFIIGISQRKLDKLQKWANIEDESNSELIYKAKKKDGNSARYVAINLQNYATIEVRIFRGTLNPQSFYKNIEFVYSLFMYTKEFNEISLDGYKEYISNSCDYSNLKKFIKLKNL
jgi:hypothetical protein